MATIGVDAGAIATKVVVVDGSRVLSRAWAHSSVRDGAARAMDEALKSAGLDWERVRAVVATGIGRNEVPRCTEKATEIVCAARGATCLVPGAHTVLDIGAESSRAIRCDDAGRVVDFVLNDKCAAGSGVFMEAMAKALRVPVPEMGEMSLRSTQEVNITAMCVVFAESEVVSQIHRKVSKEDILSGIHKSIATRLFGLVNRVGISPKLVAVGGLARNVGIVRWLGVLAGSDIVVPEFPEYAGALGAALIGGGGRE